MLKVPIRTLQLLNQLTMRKRNKRMLKLAGSNLLWQLVEPLVESKLASHLPQMQLQAKTIRRVIAYLEALKHLFLSLSLGAPSVASSCLRLPLLAVPYLVSQPPPREGLSSAISTQSKSKWKSLLRKAACSEVPQHRLSARVRRSLGYSQVLKRQIALLKRMEERRRPPRYLEVQHPRRQAHSSAILQLVVQACLALSRRLQALYLVLQPPVASLALRMLEHLYSAQQHQLRQQQRKTKRVATTSFMREKMKRLCTQILLKSSSRAQQHRLFNQAHTRGYSR